MSTIRINVTDDQGVLLDSMEIERADFAAAQASTQGSWVLLNQIQVGAEEEIPEHAFKPGDGKNSYVDVCQICQHHRSEHEEGEPCCIAFVTSRGNDHTPDCKEA